MARTSNRGSRNNNPQGHNQYTGNGWVDTAKDRPMATAAAAAAAVGAGVFLWSRRNQISDQLGNLSDQISDWTQSMRSSSDGEMAMAGTDSAYEEAGTTRSSGRRGRKSQSDMSAEALTLKQTGATANRPKAGAVG
jgi:hypothetical protein